MSMNLDVFPSKQSDIATFNIQTFYPPAKRIIAVGDVHGDVYALRSCLRIANLIDDSDKWIGEDTHLVQLGDILDRGDDEKTCLDLLFSLQEQVIVTAVPGMS
jgi:hypothetical protein